MIPRLLAALALSAAVAGCMTETVVQEEFCFVAPVDYESSDMVAPPAPRTVLREVDFSTGCIIVPLGARDYRLPPGEATAGSLVAEGDTAVLTLTGVAFLADGAQERRTIRATFALPLTLPARATEATVTTRRGAPGGAVTEETAVLGIVDIEALDGARVAGVYGGAGDPASGRFDGPVAVSGL